MPQAQLQKLPAKAREIWEAAYEEAKKKYDESRAAQIAWGAVKNAGFRKGEDGKWHKMHLVEMYFTKASRVDGEMRWAATVSKFEPDVQADEVTPEFYKYAIGQVESGRRPSPVLCISHIDKGKADDSWVAGDASELYVDGDRPKAKGTFRDTPIGRAAFTAVEADVKGDVPHGQRARISMGFFDEGSEPRVTKMDDGTQMTGRRFKQGWIKHFAMTRVPVVSETEISAELEVKSMSKRITQKEDAASIIGEELADELTAAAEKAEFAEQDLIRKQAPEDEEEEKMPEGKGEEETPLPEDKEEEEEEEKSTVEKAVADRENQIRELCTQLMALLGSEYTVDTEVANAAALGNKGTNPAPAVAVEQSQTQAVPYGAQVADIVDGFALAAKQTLLGDGDRQDKFGAIQEQLNQFGEDVVALVKEQVPPSSRDVAEAVQAAVKAVSAPMQDEIAGLKAQLADLQAQLAGRAAQPSRETPVAVPQSLDTRARVDLSQAPQVRKAWSARELAIASVQEPRY